MPSEVVVDEFENPAGRRGLRSFARRERARSCPADGAARGFECGATAGHKVEKRGDVRGERGASGAAPRQKAAREGGDKTTGSGGHAGDEAFTDDRSSGNREGRLRGGRGADMMDNVRRVDEEPAD